MIHSPAIFLRVHTQHGKVINEDRFGILVYAATFAISALLGPMSGAQ